MPRLTNRPPVPENVNVELLWELFLNVHLMLDDSCLDNEDGYEVTIIMDKKGYNKTCSTLEEIEDTYPNYNIEGLN